jgi:hypothetical protein
MAELQSGEIAFQPAPPKASAGYDNGSLVVNVVNRHKDQAIDRAPVKPSQRSRATQGKTLRYSFPPQSFSMIRAKVAEAG